MIVSMSAYNRPGYLGEVLDALYVAADRLDEPVFITARVEPSEVQNEIVALFRPGRGTYVTVNDERLGCCWNIKAAVEDGWALAHRFGEDFVFHLEDDFVLAPDALIATAWMRETYRNDQDVFTTGLWGRRREFLPGDELCVYRSRHFSAQGWGIWEDRWLAVRDQWRDRDDPRPGHYRGWDPVMDEELRGERCQIMPSLPRLYHVGVEGQHSTVGLYPKTLPYAFAGYAPEGVLDVPDIPDGEFRECE